MTQIPNKTALLEQIERERGIWEQLLAEIGADRMLEPGATGEWRFKDVVAHLNGWRTKTLARLDAAGHDQPPPWPADLSMDGQPLAGVITASFGRLHEEHAPALRAWIDQLKQAHA
jgi:hypothetical protein